MSDAFPRDLSDADALLWRIETDPVLRSPVVVVAQLDREPPWPAAVAAFERAAELLPRLHQRVTSGWAGRLRWEDDAGFAVEHHLRVVRAAEGDGMTAALAVAEPDVMAPFDPARPLWQATLVEGIGGGRSALVLRFHHSITDGIGGIDLADAIFDRTRRPAPRALAAPSGNGGRPARSRSLAARAAAAAGTAADTLTDPIGAARAAGRAAASVSRILTPARSPRSPILVGRGIDRRLVVAEAPLADLEVAAAAIGGTVNDVFLGAVAGALRRYHDRLGHPVAALSVTMPISLRRPGDAPGGNRFAPARFVLPIDDPDPGNRARLAGAIVRQWRAEPSLRLTDLLAGVLNRLPGTVVVRLFGGLLRGIDVDAVDVPGLRRPAFLAGARVDRLWAFAPPTGAALSITLVSHADLACIGVACDTAAVARPDLLGRCLDEALEEVAAATTAPALAGAAP